MGESMLLRTNTSSSSWKRSRRYRSKLRNSINYFSGNFFKEYFSSHSTLGLFWSYSTLNSPPPPQPYFSERTRGVRHLKRLTRPLAVPDGLCCHPISSVRQSTSFSTCGRINWGSHRRKANTKAFFFFLCHGV